MVFAFDPLFFSLTTKCCISNSIVKFNQSLFPSSKVESDSKRLVYIQLSECSKIRFLVSFVIFEEPFASLQLIFGLLTFNKTTTLQQISRFLTGTCRRRKMTPNLCTQSFNREISRWISFRH